MSTFFRLTRMKKTAVLAVMALLTVVSPTPPQARPGPEVSPGAIADAARQRAGDMPRASRDGVRDDQWQLDLLRARQAWQHSDGSGVIVAVLDSGVDQHHPDLEGQVLHGIDLVEPGGDGRVDPVGHGTTVAALIAGRDDDDRGVVGLAPGALILPVRVLDGENRYRDARVVAEGVRWAVDHGAHVINLSLGGAMSSQVLAEAIDYAFARDVVVIACAGNADNGEGDKVWYPAREPGVVAVAAVEQVGKKPRRWPNSITGEQTVLTAPGSVLTGARPGGYWRVQGTSFAAPLVSASAALVRSRWPELSAGNVVNRLIRTARDLGATGRDSEHGFGLVDPVAALTDQVATVTGNPLDTAPPPGRAGFGAAPGPIPASPGPDPSHAFPPPARPGKATFAAALAGAGVLVGAGLTLLRRLTR